jgi:hypothetical protein
LFRSQGGLPRCQALIRTAPAGQEFHHFQDRNFLLIPPSPAQGITRLLEEFEDFRLIEPR